MPLGIQTALFAEIMGFIKAIEIAVVKNWFPLWIETDSTALFHKVRTRSEDVPRVLKVRWRKCMNIIFSKRFKISHIFREGNGVANAMANVGLHLSDFTWW